MIVQSCKTPRAAGWPRPDPLFEADRAGSFRVSADFLLCRPGRKQALSGGEVFRCDPGHYLSYRVDLPLVFRVEEASQERPCLGLRLTLDPSLVASVVAESGVEAKPGDASLKAMGVGTTDADLLDAVVRLVRLLDAPTDRKVLAPLITREIVYRLLVGGRAHGSAICWSRGRTPAAFPERSGICAKTLTGRSEWMRSRASSG